MLYHVIYDYFKVEGVLVYLSKPTLEARHSSSKYCRVVDKRNAGQHEDLLDDDRIVSYRVLKVSVGQNLCKTCTHINGLPCEDNIYYIYMQLTWQG